MSDPATQCWICSSTAVVYTDVLGCGWCQKDFDGIYWGRVPGE